MRSKGKQDAYKKNVSRQPVIQVDFAYFTTTTDAESMAVMTAVDIQTQMCMAVTVPDKSTHIAYMTNSLRSFVLECGRTNGILQSDNEPTLKSVINATAAKVGNMTTRTAPNYSSNSQGSVDRFHRTLFGQVKALREQLQSVCKVTVNNNHPLLPWMVRHAAWILNRYLVHSDGLTSYQRRWERSYKHAICEFGERILYRTPAKRLPKGDLALQKGVWLGCRQRRVFRWNHYWSDSSPYHQTTTA